MEEGWKEAVCGDREEEKEAGAFGKTSGWDFDQRCCIYKEC